MMQDVLEGFLLSVQQRRQLQVVEQGHGRRPRGVLRLEGVLNRTALQAAGRDLVGRHEILFTRYAQAPGMAVPLQVVGEPEEPAIRYLSQGDLPAGEGWKALLASDRGEAEGDIETGLGLRLVVAEAVGEEGAESWILLSVHPLCADSQSLQVLMSEFAELYLAHCAGRAPQGISEEPWQYADFSQWQSDVLEDEDGAVGRAFWRDRKMANDAKPLPWLLESEGEPGPSTIIFLEISGADSWGAKASALAERLGISEEAILLAAWRMLLTRCVGGHEPLVWVGLDGRDYDEFKDSVGLYNRFAPLVSPIECGSTFAELACGDALHLAEMRSRQKYLAWDLPGASPGDVPPALIWGFEVGEIPGQRAEGGASLSTVHLDGAGEHFQLRLLCQREEEGWRAAIAFDSAQLETVDVKQLVGAYEALLLAALETPDQRVGNLEMLSEDQRREVLALGRSVARPVDASGVHELIARQALETPEAIALEQGDKSLSYAELDRRAGVLAARLRQLDLKPEARVVLCLRRGFEMAIGVLGVWRAGVSFLAFHPDHPHQRLERILEDAHPDVVLGPAESLEVVPPSDALRLTFEEIDFGPDAEVADIVPVEPGQLAYTVYTSGTTGTPKGIEISHAGLVSYLSFLVSEVGLESSDTVVQIPELIYDASLRDLMGPLIQGARVALVGVGQMRDPANLWGEMIQHRVTAILAVVPTVLRLVLDAAEDGLSHSMLRILCTSGEVLFPDDVQRARKVFSEKTRVFNLYGPSECTLTTTCYPIPLEIQAERLPLGHPVANARLRVVDRRLRAVLHGMLGEACIGGPGLARGYLGLPARTAESFVPDPFSGLPGARLYRTGDLTFWSHAGDLELVGRLDHQIKLLGVRVEPVEIEAELRRLPGVRAAVVGVRVDTETGMSVLVAWVSGNEKDLSAERLRQGLREVLPAGVVPGAFVPLDHMPRTASGKIDRRALELPERSSDGMQATQPMGPYEEAVAEIWREVLGDRVFGRDDDFFLLGGHSLLATQVMARLRQVLGVELELREIFEAPTLVQLSRRVERARNSGAKAPPLTRTERGEHSVVSFAQQSHWLLDKLESNQSTYNIPLAVRMAGKLDPNILAGVLNEIVRRHEVLRTTFTEVDGELRQVVQPMSRLELPWIDLSELDEERREETLATMVTTETRRPFDLANRWPVYLMGVKVGPEDHAVLLTLHHVAGDRWSAAILIREVVLLYRALMAGKPSPLPELPVQYADFAAWQRGWLRGEMLEEQLDWWREELAGAPEVLELPISRTRPSKSSGRSGKLAFELGPQLRDGLRELGREEGTTLFQTLLAAYQSLLHGYSGDTDIVVGSPVANRTHAETEGLVGCFINAIALRGRMKDDPSFREFLGRLRQTLLGAYAHQDLPFEHLVRELARRKPGVAPIFQVVFNFADNLGDSIAIPGLTFSPLRPETTFDAKYDLSLSMADTPEGIQCSITYSLDLFEEAAIQKMAEHLEGLLTDLVSRPDARLSELVGELKNEVRSTRVSRARELRAQRKKGLKGARRRQAVSKGDEGRSS